MRYDGEIKHYPELLTYIQQHFSTLSVCPEVEMGLSVPRPPLQLTGSLSNIEMTGRDDPALNVTQAMQHFCRQRPPQLNAIAGYIFKSRSPSCGPQNIPLFDTQGLEVASTRGLFVSAMLQHYPGLPITDELQLTSAESREHFLQQVKHYRQHHHPHTRDFLTP